MADVVTLTMPEETRNTSTTFSNSLSCPSTHPIALSPQAQPLINPNYRNMTSFCALWDTFWDQCGVQKIYSWTLQCAKVDGNPPSASNVVAQIINPPSYIEWNGQNGGVYYVPPYGSVFSPHYTGLIYSSNEVEILGYTCFQGTRYFSNIDMNQHCPSGYKGLFSSLRSSSFVSTPERLGALSGFCGIKSSPIFCAKVCN